MATSAQDFAGQKAPHLPVIRAGFAAAAAAFVFLLLCWIGAILGIGPASHMVVRMFSGLDAISVSALLVGLCWALVGGFVAGALFAVMFNSLAFLDRR
jgi:hypothetical protein